MSDHPDIVRTLRGQLRSEQRALLDRIWKHQRATGGVLPRLQLHLEQGDADEVQRILLPLGASVVQLQGRNGDEPAGYRLTILGALLTTEGEAIEILLGAILADIRLRQSTDHKFTVYDHVVFTNLCGMYPAAAFLVPVLFRMHGPFHWDGSADPKNVQLAVPEAISEALLKKVEPQVLVRTLVGKTHRVLTSLDPSSLWRTSEPDLAPRGVQALQTITPHCASDRSEGVLREAEALLLAKGAPSAVDRIHTGLNGILRDVVTELDIAAPEKADSNKLIDLLRTHAAFSAIDVRPNETRTILRTLAVVPGQLDAMRNNASNAHAAKDLLTEAEAMLAINAARTVMHYVDMRVREHLKAHP